jgi:hypothetical protein
MNKSALTTNALLALNAALLAVLVMLSVDADDEQPLWQYKRIESADITAEGQANTMGITGWELVNSYPKPGSNGGVVILDFKRPAGYEDLENANP